jgi:hypothetical protein
MHQQRLFPHIGIAVIILTGLALAACQPQPVATYYKGYQADKSAMVRLDRVPAQGHWKTFDLGVDYQFERQGNELDIRGAARHGLYYELNTSRIIALDLYLHFADQEGRVLETALLKTVVNAAPEDEIPFSDRITIPAGATAFAFGYVGRAREDGGQDKDNGGGGGGTDYYDNLPKRG